MKMIYRLITSLPSQLASLPSWEQLLALLSIVLPTVIYLVGRWFDKKKDEKSIEVSSAEIEEKKALVRKTEAEINENFLKSANELVEEYKQMLEKLNVKYTQLEERLGATEAKLEKEIQKRRTVQRITRELFRGLNALINQLNESRTTPRWMPDAKILEAIKKLDEEE